MKNPIEWSASKIKIALINPTPDNYKIKNALGYERFLASIRSFGMAGTVILNPNKKRYTLIDGNSRIEEAKKKKRDWVWASIPSRPLTPAEFKEMSAMFDYAAAGDVDIERITRDYGKSADFFKKYGLQVPPELLETMGANAGKVAAFPKGKKGGAEPELVDTKIVQLFFTNKQEDEFRKWEEKLMKKLKTSNTTETVWKVFKTMAKVVLIGLVVAACASYPNQSKVIKPTHKDAKATLR